MVEGLHFHSWKRRWQRGLWGPGLSEAPGVLCNPFCGERLLGRARGLGSTSHAEKRRTRSLLGPLPRVGPPRSFKQEEMNLSSSKGLKLDL